MLSTTMFSEQGYQGIWKVLNALQEYYHYSLQAALNGWLDQVVKAGVTVNPPILVSPKDLTNR